MDDDQIDPVAPEEDVEREEDLDEDEMPKKGSTDNPDDEGEGEEETM